MKKTAINILSFLILTFLLSKIPLLTDSYIIHILFNIGSCAGFSILIILCFNVIYNDNFKPLSSGEIKELNFYIPKIYSEKDVINTILYKKILVKKDLKKIKDIYEKYIAIEERDKIKIELKKYRRGSDEKCDT